MSGVDPDRWARVLGRNPAGNAAAPSRDELFDADPFWSTPNGLRLRDEMAEVEALIAEKAARKAAEEQAAMAAQRVQQAAEAIAAREAYEARRAEDEARAEIERNAELNARLAEWNARNEAAALKRLKDEARLLLARTQDPDYHVMEIVVGFEIEGTTYDCDGPPNSDDGPDNWEFDEDMGVNAQILDRLVVEVGEALVPWTSHFRTIGAIRADNLDDRGGRLGYGGLQASATFYLVYHADDAHHGAEALAQFNPISIALQSLPDAMLQLYVRSGPINASLLFDALSKSPGDVGIWAGEATPELMPVEAEGRDAWLARVAATSDHIVRVIERWDASGRDVKLFASYGALDTRSGRPIEYVGGLWPKGYVSLVVGSNGSGKSTAMHEWVAAAGGVEMGRPRRVWGCDLTGRIVAALVSGEDGEDMIAARAKYFTPLWGAPQYFAIDAHELTLAELIELLDRVPCLDLWVIDPARVHQEGNEDSSDSVSTFYKVLASFARRKNCAVVVVHHLTKGEHRPLRFMLQAIRGSGVHSDRARLVIGITKRSGDVVDIGIIKGNFPPAEPIWKALGGLCEGRQFVRDPETLTLKPAGGEPAPSRDEDGDKVRVMAVLRPLIERGEKVYQTGTSSLYARKLVELSGLSRPRIETAVKSLIAASAIVDDGAGLRLGRA